MLITSRGVVSISKIGKMKAIHNFKTEFNSSDRGVVSISKIGKMKAIHNSSILLYNTIEGVVSISKIGKMKAIHNYSHGEMDPDRGVVSISKIRKIWWFKDICYICNTFMWNVIGIIQQAFTLNRCLFFFKSYRGEVLKREAVVLTSQ